jgi:opacity protein-like surface antigen
MRFIILLATSSLAAGHAAAQGSSWDGTYAGVTGGVSGLAPDTGVSIDVARAGRPDGNYTGTTYNPVGGVSRFDSEISSESTAAFAVFAGTSFDQGGYVWGAEAKLEVAPIERNYSVGPVRYFPTGPSGSAATFPLPANITPQPGGITQILQENETLSSSLQLDYNLSLRGKIGVPISDALLVSAHAGIAMTQAQLDVRQDSEQLGAYLFRLNGQGPLLSTAINRTTTDTVSAEETLIGVTLGGLAEYKLTDNLIARADVTWTKYGDIGVTTGPGSEVSIEPSTWSASLGIAFKL